ncbi:unnamed protein product, partial [Allacma fusca]
MYGLVILTATSFFGATYALPWPASANIVSIVPAFLDSNSLPYGKAGNVGIGGGIAGGISSASGNSTNGTSSASSSVSTSAGGVGTAVGQGIGLNSTGNGLATGA